MKSLSLAIALSGPFVLSSFSLSTAEKPPELTKESYTFQKNDLIHDSVLVPLRDESLNVRQSAPGFDKEPTTGRLNRRGLFRRNGFRLVEYGCSNRNDNRCDNARTAVEMAFEVIEKVLDLRNSITVKVNFGDFQDKDPELVAYTTPTLLVSVDHSDGKKRLYPAALLKQLKRRVEGKNLPPDIVFDFNAGKDFYFPSENRPIRNHEYDFLMIALHELVHGLGFVSSWSDYGTVPDTTPSLSPNIMVNHLYDDYVTLGNFYENIFDKFLIDTSDSTFISKHSDAFEKVARSMNAKRYQNFEQLWSATILHPIFQSTSKSMVDLATKKGSIAFLNNDGSKLVLETSLSPFDENSINHMDCETFEESPDFLMVTGGLAGESLAQLIKVTGSEGPIGPNIIKALETMGYTRSRGEHPFPLDSFSFWNNYKNGYKDLPSGSRRPMKCLKCL